MAIIRYAGDRFVGDVNTTTNLNSQVTGVLDGAFYTSTGNLKNFVKRSAGWAQLAGGGGGSTDPAGADNQVQFNDNGVFGATTGLTFDGQRLYANNFQLSGILYDSNASVGEGGMVLANEGTTGVHWKNIESVLSGVGGSGVANYVARWSDEDTLTSGTIYDNGNVGIGTAVPGTKLHVYDTVAGDMVTIESTNPNHLNAPDIVFYRNSASPADSDDLGVLKFRGRNNASPANQNVNYAQIEGEAISVADGAEGGALNFHTHKNGTSAVRMVITGDYVGIGTPTPQYALEVAVDGGEFDLTDSGDSYNRRVRLGDSSGNGGYITIYDDSEAGNVILRSYGDSSFTGGSVGIGTTAPNARLEVEDGGTTSSVILKVTADDQGPYALMVGNDTYSTTDTDGIGMWINNAGQGKLHARGAGSQLILGAAGTNYVYLLSDGKVGIGTTDPGAKLHVYGGNIRISSTDDKPQLEFFETAAARWVIGHSTAPNNYFAISEGSDVAASERLVIAPTTGSVGIGYATPAYALDIRRAAADIFISSTTGTNRTGFQAANTGGTSYFYRDASSGTGVFSGSTAYATIIGGTGAYSLHLGTNGAVKMTIDSAGKVGIGTPTPDSKLEIAGGGYNSSLKIKSSGADSGIQFEDSAGNTDGYIYANGDSIGFLDSGTNYTIQCKNDDYIKFSTNGDTEHMRIQSDGNVGIGTTAAAALLEVETDQIIKGGIVRDGSWHRGLEITTENANYASLFFGNQQTTKYSGIVWTSSTSGNTGNKRGAQIYAHPTSATNTNLAFDTNNIVGSSSPTTKMTILGDGNVGIGITAPGYKTKIVSPSLTWGTTINDDTAALSVVKGYQDGANDSDVNVARFASVRASYGAAADWAGHISLFTNSSVTNGSEGTERARITWDGNNRLYFGKSTDKVLTVQTAGGNVGIGDNLVAPEHKLHVSGDAIISGVLYDSTNSSGVAGHVFTSEVGGPQWKMIEDVLSGVGGNGTAEYIPRWTDSDTIGDSVISQSGSNIGINMTAANPATELHIGSLAAPTQGGNWASLSIGEDNYPERRTQINAYRSLRGADWDHMGISFQPHTSSSHLDGPTITGMVIDYDGYVGIGTNAPGSLLRVEGSNATAYDGAAAQDGDGITLSIWNQDETALGSYAALQLVNKGTGSHGKARIACIAPANNQGALAFTVESAGTFKEAMRILGDGNVGIGTSSTSELLHAYKTANAAIAIAVQNPNTGNDARARIQLMSDGGTATLTTYSAAFTTSNQNIADSALLRASSLSGGLGLSADGATPLHFWTNDTERMRILSDGKVGIGTITPDNILDIQSSGTPTLCVRNSAASADAMIHVGEPNTTAYGLQIKWVGSTGRVYFDNRYNHATNPYMYFRMRTSGTPIVAMTIDPAGNVGIGCADPTSRLTVEKTSTATTLSKDGTVLMLRGADGANKYSHIGFTYDIAGDVQPSATIGIQLTSWTASTKSDLVFGTRDVTTDTAPTERMRITSAGKVGIGTTNPAALLDVRGTVKVGVDDAGHDVMLYGATSGRYWEWDQSMDLVRMRDNVKSVYGNGDDLQIYHSGADSYIVDSGAGDLYIRASNELRLQDSTGTDNFLYALEGGDVRLYYDGAQKLGTTSTGVTVTGGVVATSFSGNGASVTNLNALNITAGTVATARLGTGTADSSTFLRGDNTWVANANGTVTSVTAGVGLTISAGSSTVNPTLATKLDELTDMTAAVVGGTDQLILLDNGDDRRKTINTINLGQFNNDQGWTSNAGTVTSVTAGTGMTQTGSATGATTLNVGGGVGIDANASNISLNLSELTSTNAPVTADKMVFIDNGANASFEFSDVPLSIFSNDAGWTSNSAANPTATVGPTAVNGSAATYMRSDAAPALANTSVSAGSYTYASITVDAQGRLTAASSGSAPGGGTVTGTGTANYISRWSGTSSQNNSNIFDNGAIGIGTAANLNSVLNVFGDTGANLTSIITCMSSDAATNGGAGIFLKASSNPSLNRFGVQIAALRNSNTNGSADLVFKLEKTDATGLAERMRILGSGKVGIGTEGPSTLLHVYNNTASTAAELKIENATANLNAALMIKTTVSDWDVGSNINAAAGSFEVYERTSGSAGSRLTILSGGKVGIGTNSPATKLTVHQSADDNGLRIYGYDDVAARYAELFVNSAGYTVLDASTDRGLVLKGHGIDFYVNSGGTHIGRWTFGGNLGIGTTSPDGTLHVETGSAGTITAEAYADDLIIENSDHVGISLRCPDAKDGFILFQSATNDRVARISAEYNGGDENLAFAVDDDDKMVINDSGNVGIGTDDPSVLLDVYQATVADSAQTLLKVRGTNDAQLRVEGANDNTSVGYGTNRSGGALMLRNTNNTVGNYESICFSNADNYVNAGIHAINVAHGVGGATRGRLEFWTRNTGNNYHKALEISDSSAVTFHTSTGAVAYTLPNSDGSAGYHLETDGSGTVTWEAGGPGTVTSITAGSGLSGGTITTSGTIANTDKGSSQNIFKKVRTSNSVGNQIGLSTANSNDDTIDFRQGTGITLATSGDVVTITAANNGTVTGTGTTNYISKWTGTSSQGNSTISDNGSIVTVASDFHVYKAGADKQLWLSEGTSGSGATNVQLSSNGVSYLKGGSVGIGTAANLNSVLNVYGGTSSGPTSIITCMSADATVGGGAGIFFKTSNNHSLSRYGAQIAAIRRTNDNGSADLLFKLEQTNATGLVERMRILGDGNVGIGTNNPSRLLDVNGTAYFRDDIYFGNTVLNPASGFSNQTGMGWDKSTGALQIASTGTAALEVGRHTNTGSIFVCRYGSFVKATIDTSGDMSISGTLSEASSLAIKENVETYSPSLEKINKMRAVRFNKKKSKKKEVGLVAEELAEMFPELVEMDKDGKPCGVNYSRAVAVLLHGFKELYKEVKELKEKI